MQIPQAFRAFFLLLVCGQLSALALDGESRTEADSYRLAEWPQAAFEVSFFAPDFPRYGGAFSEPNRKPGWGMLLGFEYMPLVGQAGKLGATFSTGYGRIGSVQSPPFLEVLPIDLTATYRLDIFEDQLLVPIIHTGLTFTHVHQQSVPGWQRFNGWEYGGGVAICLDFIDNLSAQMLDRSVGIQNTYALVDYRRVNALGQLSGPDLSRDELRFSLRFEY